jgi:hypothetical protein
LLSNAYFKGSLFKGLQPSGLSTPSRPARSSRLAQSTRLPLLHLNSVIDHFASSVESNIESDVFDEGGLLDTFEEFCQVQ